MLNLISYVIAALFGGSIVSIIDWFRTYRREKRERHISILREQIQHLYGPIYYLVSQNKTLFQASANIHKAAEDAYFGKRFASSVLETVTKDVNKTIEIANRYIELVVKNNEKIMDILNNNIHLAEIEDYENFSIFVKDYFRLQIETGRILKSEKEVDKTDSDPKLPFSVVLKLPRISFLDENFIKMVETRFFEIKNEYNKYCK